MRISVALCTFNGQAYLARQLRSLADQERRPDELVVFDDASTDGTVQILRDFVENSPFEVRLHVNPARLGMTGNFQSSIAAANGDMIACCDQDDVWYPEKLALLEEEFSNGPADMVFSDADLVDDQLRPLGRRLWESIGFDQRQLGFCRAGLLWSRLIRFNAVTGAGMAFSSAWRDLLLPIPKGWVHDGWIAMLLSIVGRSRAVEEPLWAYRRHGGQQIGAGPAGLAQTVEMARRMDQAYFQLLEANYTVVMNRLSRLSLEPCISDHLWEKIVHCRNRAAMRSARAKKSQLIAAELFSGRYGRCALGWKSLAQDIWLARAKNGK